MKKEGGENIEIENVVKDRNSRFNRLMCSLGRSLSSIQYSVLVVVTAVCEVLKYPLLMALLALDMVMVVPFMLCLCMLWGLIAILPLLVSQSPIIYLVAKEIWRLDHMLPMSEALETTTERWNEVFEEYAEEFAKRDPKP